MVVAVTPGRFLNDSLCISFFMRDLPPMLLLLLLPPPLLPPLLLPLLLLPL